MGETSLRNRDRSKYRLYLDSVSLNVTRKTFILTKLLLDESSFGTNFELSSPFYCCISKKLKNVPSSGIVPGTSYMLGNDFTTEQYPSHVKE